MASKEGNITAKYSLDVSEFKRGVAEATKALQTNKTEVSRAKSEMELYGKSSETLKGVVDSLKDSITQHTKKISNYEKQLSAVSKVEEEASKDVERLRKELEIAKSTYGENSKQAKGLAKELTSVEKAHNSLKGQVKTLTENINKEKTAMNKTQKEINGYEAELKNVDKAQKLASKSGKSIEDALKDIGKEADNTESKVGKLAKGLAGGIKAGIAGLGTAAVGAVAGFLALGEATQDTMEDMGKLQAGFTSSGHSMETAKKSYEGMVGILGETDQSVEAVNHLAKLTKSEEELAKWTDIAAGVYGTFGDSLPLEGLTEAANETAKVGKVTGPLADALNWAGISEEEFNKKLEACNSEQERATLITETLSSTYLDAANAYKEANADLIASREATAEFNVALSELGRVAMPFNTMLKEMGTQLITALLPGLTQVGEGLKGMINGTEGASEAFKSGIGNLISTLIGKFTESLPMILEIGQTILLSLLEGIGKALPSLIQTLTEIIPQLTETFLAMLPELINIATVIITELLKALGDLLPTIVSQIIEILPAIIDALVDAIPLLLDAAIEFLMAIVKAIPEILPQLYDAVPKIVTSLVEGLIELIPALLDGAIMLFEAIIDAIPILIENLAPKIPMIIETIVDLLIKSIPMMLQTAIKLFTAIINAIPKIITTLGKEVPKIISKIAEGLGNGISKIKEKAGEIGTAIIEKVKELPDKVKQIGKDIIEGLKKGIQEKIASVKNAVTNLADNLPKWVKKILGIKSPSKVFADEIGKYIPEGIAVGIEGNTKSLKKSIQNMANQAIQMSEGLLSGMNVPSVGSLNGGSISNSSKTVIINQTLNSPRAYSRAEIYRQTKNIGNLIAQGG